MFGFSHKLKHIIFCFILSVIIFNSLHLMREKIYEMDTNSASHNVETSQRLGRLKTRFKNFTLSNSLQQPTILFLIIAAKRNYGALELDYPYQSLASLLEEMQGKRGNNATFAVCNVSPQYLDLSHLARLIGNAGIINITQTSKFKSKKWVYKELNDYILCLKAARTRHPNVQYIVFQEDDGITLPGFREHLANVLSQLQFREKRDSRSPGAVSHVKLYHPLSLRKLPWIIYMIVVPLLFISIAYPPLTNFKFAIVYVLMIGAFLAATIFTLGANRTGILHYTLTGRLSLISDESCCTVSVLYPTANLDRTVTFLEQEKQSDEFRGRYRAKDTILDTLPWKTDMAVLMTEFNLVEHIGVYSTRF